MITYPTGHFVSGGYIAYSKPKNADNRRIHFAREVYTTDKNKTKRALICFFMCFLLILPSSRVFAAAGPTLRTTLSDNTTQRGSKKTFDVWARNASGEKIKATVTFNGEKLSPTWDDNEKSSYTLNFTFEGDNTVVVSASSDGGRKKQLTYHINYEKARQGEKIGTAVWSVEMFTIGCGYLVYPQKVNIYEGETSAQQLLRLLNENGYVGYYGGSVSSSFYLAYVADGTASAARYNNYQRSSSASSPKALGISPTIPSVLVPHLKSTMTFYDPGDYEKNWKGHLGEFVITNGSGWMYSVNNVFPNVGFADIYLSDGDIVRVQFTLGYGADIGGFGAMGTSIPNVENQPKSGYFSVANKDLLTKAIERTIYSGLITRSNVKNAYAAALSVAETLDASQSAVDNAVSAINSALQNPGSETNSAPADAPLSVGGSGAHVSSGAALGGKNASGGAAAAASGGSADAVAASAAEESAFSETDAGTEEITDASEALSESEESTENAVSLSENKKSKTLVTVICLVSAFIVLAGGVCFIVFYVKKRRKNGEKEKSVKESSSQK